MTKKVAENDLKKLIEEVLKEEQRLDEKTSADLTKWDKTKGSPKRYKGQSFTGDNISDPGKKNREVADIDAIAAADGEANNLSVTDIEDAIAGKVTNQKLRATGIKKKMDKGVWDFTTGSPAATKLPGKLGESPYNLKTNSTDAQFQTASKTILTTITDHVTLQAAAPLFKNLMTAFKTAHKHTNSKYKAELTNFNAKKAAFPKPGPSTSARGALDVSNPGITAADRTYTQMYSDPEFDVANVSQAKSDLSGEETDAELTTAASSFSAAADSSAIAVAELFGGAAGTEGEFVALGKEMKTVADQIKSIGGRRDKTAGLTGPAAFKFAAQANFLFQLFNAGKMAEGKQAGYDFERFCGLLFGGLVAGKSNLAADVISASKKGFLRTSQKFVQDTASISQSAENTYKLVVTKGIPLYYMALIKGGKDGAASYDNIDMYLIKLEKSRNNKIQRSYMNPSGTFKNFGAKLTAPAPGEYYALYADTVKPIKIDLGLSALGKDPTKAAKAVADKIAGSTSADVQKIHEASTQIYQLSKNMLRNTEEYRAVKGGSTAAGKAKQPMDYLNQLSDDYMTLKTNYKGLFGMGGESVTGTAFAEGKKITADFLKKLISESFKR